MLLLHQTGSVRVGEVVRYTLTYTPSIDRILPPPTHLHVKIKNTSAIPLRAAYLHGPYTLYVACYPSTFDPYKKHETSKEEGAPEYEPQLKAGGHWSAKLTVPEEIRRDAVHGASNRHGDRKSFTWIIEVASQIIFSKTATVHYEVLVGRDEKSVELGFHGVVGSGQGAPGRLEDHKHRRVRDAAQSKGVFSKAVRLAVDDTESLWNTPPFPEWDSDGDVKVQEGPQHGDKRDHAAKKDKKQQKQKKIHLVLLTHGLHSNLGADMLFMKETIDTTAKQAREDSKKRRAERRAQRLAESNQFGRDAVDQRTKSVPDVALTGADDETTDDEEEEVVVRGFNGNAVRTERGIQYLGKRFAKYVLSITYPDQPYLPVKSSIGKSLSKSMPTSKPTPKSDVQPAHKHSSIIKDENHRSHNLPYKITSISFISHSLGGLVQTYAVAYIQKHSPDFFDLIKPINFVAMATPFLGLSNENPVYVKFALDFGLVGRTGQDLGLTWRAPTIAKNGWGAVLGSLTTEAHKAQKEPDPGTKPLLRILPSGPAHVALKKFRNRTVYSNVVNDGIVPLRTSCLLFLDWRGLGRVEKARRENGLVGTMVEWGWAEVTGQNASATRRSLHWNDLFGESADDMSSTGISSPDPDSSVPQAEASQGLDRDERAEPEPQQFVEMPQSGARRPSTDISSSTTSAPNLWAGLLNLFKPQAGQQKPAAKVQKIYRRGQTMHHLDHGSERSSHDTSQGSDEIEEEQGEPRKNLVRGSSLYTNNSENGDVEAPPRTTFFESAGDLLNPPLPTKEFLVDPAARPRTIWHDRVYHPEDIPPPPAKRHRTLMLRTKPGSRKGSQQSLMPSDPASSPTANPPRSSSSHSSTSTLMQSPNEAQETGSMKIEEKIARAYHKDLSWRKVLVRLEPDAHNNMIVRRMFANAYGWPVVKHMCDTHFAYTAAAKTRDEDESNVERAKPSDAVVVGVDGEKVRGQTDAPPEEVGEDSGKRSAERAQTTHDSDLAASASPSSVVVHDDQFHELHRRWTAKSGDRVQPQRSRTESEIRESRDDVSELVSLVSAPGEGSTYSSANSSKAALSRLARQDSARWSDRFFDGSDDDDTELDDEGEDVLREELIKARQRGESSAEWSAKTSARIANSLTASPRATRLGINTNTDGLEPAPLPLDGGGGKNDEHSGHGRGHGHGHGNDGPKMILAGPDTPLTAEPGELESSSDAAKARRT
ncbi:hypothetical protein LTR72_000714 [Exophiala xenobiotica]|nr:hypothetical protein LTR92_009113 [Exophiala xenobiotica]KAK5231532.1 hypothetical protein LTR72_000714 [Exophiala xenobiotica]KAK5288464.1 hypothetical protein LTR14_008324 [Exophiala xenobiotica]KAK5476739.1 hypothetical protein LTR55_008794 [Exophiala xenobiotica]